MLDSSIYLHKVINLQVVKQHLKREPKSVTVDDNQKLILKIGNANGMLTTKGVCDEPKVGKDKKKNVGKTRWIMF